MRIIAGEHRGRPLKAPKGSGTRPTTDRVRESLMSALSSARGGFEGAYVLDAFAGSGALSLEALSRGAAYACLCEKDPSALKVIEENIAMLRYGKGQARACRMDVLKNLPPRSKQAYDLLFLDPPYAVEAESVFALIGSLDKATCLAEDLVISYEHSSSANEKVDQLLEAAQLELSSRRSYGDTVIDIILRKEECL